MPKISVLMPIYNTKEQYLREAIESILNQSYEDFEFIIINDSPSNLLLDDVVKSYKDKRIIYHKNNKNIGISASRNKLIELAKGDFLAVMDHDDISLPQRFEKQIAFLESHPEYGVVSCKEKLIPNGRISSNPTNDEDIKMALMRICAITHPAAMIRKKVIIDNKIKYEEEFSPAEDYALWCRLLPYTKFHNLPEVLFYYRKYDGNTSVVQKQKLDNATLEIHSFAEIDNPLIYKKFLLKATHTTRVRLFALIPLLTIITKGYRSKIVLFGKIPLFAYKKVIKLQEKHK